MSDARKRYEELKRMGLSPEQERLVQTELNGPQSHDQPVYEPKWQIVAKASPENYQDLLSLQNSAPMPAPYLGLSSIDELLERDRQREKDGFPRKIRVGKLIRPGKGEKNAIAVVPTTVEEKFMHDRIKDPNDEDQMGGSGDGEEGEVIGEQPVRQEGEGTGAGQGQDAVHEVESSAYDLGKILTEKFELPNLKDKGSKRSLTKYTYDITDKNRGFGQVLDKKATLRQIVNTNIALGRVHQAKPVDSTGLLVSPQDRIYRILSPEKEYESQAVVFFVRDYSGSMEGNCTQLVCSQHVMIYSWLLYQYAKRVETRFILHDTRAKEVPDFFSYYNSRVAGGTEVASGFKLVNEIVENENLAQDYNIYVFHGTDGDDWDSTGERALAQLDTMLGYANRVGVTLVEHSYAHAQRTTVQQYLEEADLQKTRSDVFRFDVMSEDAEENRVIEGIRKLVAEEVPT